MILTTGRTGSELLVTLLDSHPRIACEGELLKEGIARPDQYVAARAAIAGLKGMKAYGWKVLLSQYRNPSGTVCGIGDPDRYPARLNAMGYRPIVLVRRNFVAQAMSSIRGEQTHFHHYRGERTVFTPTEVDPETLMAFTWIREAETDALIQTIGSVPHLRLIYEDDLLDPACHQSTVDRVCRYLGMESAPVSSKLVKLAPRGLREMVTNFDQVTELFRDTRYSSYLEEDPQPVSAELGTTVH